jgi:hypothetical protein
MRDFNTRYENLFVPIVSRQRVRGGGYCSFFWMRQQRQNAAKQDREQDQ